MPTVHHPKTLDENWALSTILMTSPTSAAKERQATALEAIKNGHDQALFRDLVSRIHTRELVTQAGIYLGDAYATSISIERLYPFLERIAKGLWIRHTLEPLNWDDYTVEIRMDQAIRNPTLTSLPEFKGLLAAMNWGASYDEIFGYRGAAYQHLFSAWLLHFYGSHLAAVRIIHKDGTDGIVNDEVVVCP